MGKYLSHYKERPIKDLTPLLMGLLVKSGDRSYGTIIRGLSGDTDGHWLSHAKECRSADRPGSMPKHSSYGFGFRLVRQLKNAKSIVR